MQNASKNSILEQKGDESLYFFRFFKNISKPTEKGCQVEEKFLK